MVNVYLANYYQCVKVRPGAWIANVPVCKATQALALQESFAAIPIIKQYLHYTAAKD